MTRDALLLELESTRAALRTREAALREKDLELAAERARVVEAQAEVARLLEENAALRHRVEQLARRMFGKSSERLAPGQLLLAFEAARAEEAAALEADSLETALGEETPRTPRPRRVRPSEKPSHKDLPVREERVDPPEEERVCGCGRAMARLSEETSERVEHVPASFHVVRTVRGKYACPTCADRVVVAPAPPRALEKSVVGPGLAAHVVASKYADHLPLYRQEGILARSGVHLPRSTLGDVVMRCADVLEPVARAVLASVLAGRVVHTDDTPVLYLAKPAGSVKGSVWVYVGEKGEAAYDFTPDRSREGPERVLGHYVGHVQADALKVYDALYDDKRLEVGCWAHARRYFFEALTTEREHAEQALGRIGRLYAVEREARGKSEVDRQTLRIERARPVLRELRRWMDAVAPTVLPKGPLGKAIAYATSNWTALTRYVDHGHLAIDNNAAERALRGVAVGRKNWLFAGNVESGRRAAVLMTLVATCRLQGVDPELYLADVLTRIPTFPASRVHELTPRGWKLASQRAGA